MSVGKDNRARVWQFIAYPESAPSEPWAILREFHTPFIVSPLHDKDMEKDGKTLKKPHWHIIFIFDGKHSYEQVKEISDSINAAPPVRVLNVRGAVRYLIHLDDPDKYSYHLDELKAFCGCDVSSYFAFSSTELDTAIYELEAFIITRNIYEYADLVEYTRENEKAWHYALTKTSTNHFKTYLASRRHRQHLIENIKDIQIDHETGEIND